MQRETSNDSFLDYGSVYHQPIDHEHPELIHQTMVAITRRYVSQFYCFNCDTYLQVKSGIGVLLVSHTAEAADVQEFAMNRLIHIRPNVYFAVVSTTQKLEYDLYAESSYSLHITDFPSQYEFLAVLPRIEIQKILGYYYRIRTENYCFKGERHDFFELTYVDRRAGDRSGRHALPLKRKRPDDIRPGPVPHPVHRRRARGLLYDHPLRYAQPDSRGAGGLV